MKAVIKVNEIELKKAIDYYLTKKGFNVKKINLEHHNSTDVRDGCSYCSADVEIELQEVQFSLGEDPFMETGSIKIR